VLRNKNTQIILTQHIFVLNTYTII
jgi:hypothetical protein